MLITLLTVASPNTAVSVHVLRDLGAFKGKGTFFRNAQSLTVDVTRVGPPVGTCPILKRPASVGMSIIEVLVAEQLILKIRMMRVVGEEKLSKVDAI